MGAVTWCRWRVTGAGDYVGHHVTAAPTKEAGAHIDPS
jgi:hypothetical protein